MLLFILAPLSIISYSILSSTVIAWTVSRRYPCGEVVGSSGKIGSYILHRLNKQKLIPSTDDTNNPIYPQSLNAAAVPRGVAPGCLSPNGTPIYAAIPSSSIRNVWETTLPHRRKDLVFLCNCIPSRHLNFANSNNNNIDDDDQGVTVAILHFGVSHNNNANDDASLVPIPKLNNSPQSPPTVIYGKHATTLAKLLQKDGINVQIVDSPKEVQIAASKKIAWSSLMWLMCHSFNSGNGPITVKNVHDIKSKQLQRLVEEILPSLESLASESWTRNSEDHINIASSGASLQSVGSVQDMLHYLQSYSMSISNGNVIPGKELALREIKERNGLLLSLMKGNNANDVLSEKSYHMDLLRQAAIEEEILEQCLQSGNTDDSHDTNLHGTNSKQSFQRVRCTSSNLEFLAHVNKSTSINSTTIKTAIVVGAGILGSSVAFHLSMHGAKVTVIDQRTNLLPSTDKSNGHSHHSIDPGAATSSSFAWLNANDKSPLSYKQLNHLGMEVWRRHDILQGLPVWCGSLVRSVQRDEGGATVQPKALSSYYPCVGPLDLVEASRLEPGVEWPSEAKCDTYFYPEEGHVDPVEAVSALRVSAKKNGVDFLEGIQINNLLRDELGKKVIGVEYTNSSHHDNEESLQTNVAKADVVVIAAGANSSNPVLGISNHLKLLHQPGTLAYARSTTHTNNGSGDDSKKLKRIIVDTIAQSHILLRPDDTFVIGGGRLVVGGNETTQHSEKRDSALSEGDGIGVAMIKNAVAAISPLELQNNGYDLTRVTNANRPMPCDGFPVLGFVDQGLYVAVTHSGLTLGPLLGELVAHEAFHAEPMESNNEGGSGINSQYGFQILDKYRPSQSRMMHKTYS